MLVIDIIKTHPKNKAALMIFYGYFLHRIYRTCMLCYVSEYIVGFKGYYTAKARKGYITAALDEAGVNAWHILPRDNALTEYPSDFDVIRVSQTGNNMLRLWGN